MIGRDPLNLIVGFTKWEKERAKFNLKDLLPGGLLLSTVKIWPCHNFMHGMLDTDHEERPDCILFETMLFDIDPDRNRDVLEEWRHCSWEEAKAFHKAKVEEYIFEDIPYLEAPKPLEIVKQRSQKCWRRLLHVIANGVLDLMGKFHGLLKRIWKDSST